MNQIHRGTFLSTDDFQDLEIKIRDILDRNGFASQKINLKKLPDKPIQQEQPAQKNHLLSADAFRIRVMQPLRFSVEIVKPLQLKDFLFLAGRLNFSPQHQTAIEKLDSNKRFELLDELRLELGRKAPTVKFDFANGKTLKAIECMVPVIITEHDLVKDLFTGMDAINKSFFTVIFVLQSHLRKAGVNFTQEGRADARGSFDGYS